MPLSAPFKGSYFSSDSLSCPFSPTINRHILYWNRCSALKFWYKLQKRKKHFFRRFLTIQHIHSLPQTICLGWHFPWRPMTADLMHTHISLCTLHWEQNAKSYLFPASKSGCYWENCNKSTIAHRIFLICKSQKAYVLSGDGCYWKQQLSSGFK